MTSQEEMDNTLSGPVDVLTEMQADIDALEQRVLAGEFTLSRGYDKVNRLRSIHAAVAELIELSHVIDAEFRSDPMAVQCFDLGVLKRWQDALANVGSEK